MQVVLYIKFTENNSGWDFECQHGPRECEGNKVQACILDQVTKDDEYVPLISCMMASDDPPTAADVCLDEMEITSTTPDNIAACAQSDEGSNLLHDIGVETENLDPSLYFVPWILFNDVIVIALLRSL